MAAGDDQTTFTVRYQLAPADAGKVFWSFAPNWLPWLIGIALLTIVCAIWRPLGHAGRVGAIFFPVATFLWMLTQLNRVRKHVEIYLGREMVLVFGPAGLRTDSGLARSEIPWTTVREIARRRAYWFFQTRNGGTFFVPTAAIPVEARAFIARWAGDARVRLT